MIVALDAESVVPPYEQLRAQIATLIASGILAPGERLPAIRQLAGDLGVASGTVARAYRELESLALVRAKKRGTFVSDVRQQDSGAAAHTTGGALVRAADAFALAAWQLGVPPEQSLAAARNALARYPVRD